jgi:hypothetical protein
MHNGKETTNTRGGVTMYDDKLQCLSLVLFSKCVWRDSPKRRVLTGLDSHCPKSGLGLNEIFIGESFTKSYPYSAEKRYLRCEQACSPNKMLQYRNSVQARFGSLTLLIADNGSLLFVKIIRRTAANFELPYQEIRACVTGPTSTFATRDLVAKVDVGGLRERYTGRRRQVVGFTAKSALQYLSQNQRRSPGGDWHVGIFLK